MASDVLRFIKILLLLISFVGAIVAFYLLYLNSHQYFMGTTDVSGVIIPTLAILVTLLVGWNIYSALGIESKLNKTVSEQKQYEEQQRTGIAKFENEVNSKIDSLNASIASQIEQQINKRMNNAEKAYISLFNATQAQIAAAINDKDYLQQYSYQQNALSALLQCEKFPSDIRVNIKVILSEMEKLLDLIEKSNEGTNASIYKMDEDYKKEFIPNMDEISRSPRVEFSFEDRQKFMEISARALRFFERTQTE